MEYSCISADGHIDLAWLPHDLFVSNASQAMKDRMPHVITGPDGPVWVTQSGLKLCLANGNGFKATASGGRSRYVPGMVDRFDRMAAVGLFKDAENGIYRPTTPELRLQDQDRDGIQAEVMYGLHATGYKITDRQAMAEFYRVYNDWLSNFCSHNRKRLVGLASIPCYDVDAAVAETRRAAKLGLGGLDFLASWDMTPLWDPYWAPFWKAAADVNLAVHFHVIGPRPETPLPKDASETVKLARSATLMAEGPLSLLSILAAVIHSGALEQFPSLRIVLGESGIAWIPHALERMDEVYENRLKRRGFKAIKMKPSEYWRRQCRATFQADHVGVNNLLEVVGVETVMWGSDYPHGDSLFPDSQECIKRQFSHLPSATQRKISCDNAGKFYGLIP